MAKTHVVYLIEENGKSYACAATIENGYDVLSWGRERKASDIYIFPTKKECEKIEELWNQGLYQTSRIFISGETIEED